MKDPGKGKPGRQTKTMVWDLPSQQNKNRHIRQKIYNPKRDSENSKRKDSRKKKNVNGLG